MEAAEARPSLHMSKYRIVGNHMHWLNYGTTDLPLGKQYTPLWRLNE